MTKHSESYNFLYNLNTYNDKNCRGKINFKHKNQKTNYIAKNNQDGFFLNQKQSKSTFLLKKS